MPRSVNLVASRRRKKNILKFAKGFWGRRKNAWTIAKNAVEKSWEYSYIGRKIKKRDYRSLWIQRINAGLRSFGFSYSVFIKNLKDKKILIDRKMIAKIVYEDFDSFKSLVNFVMLS